MVSDFKTYMADCQDSIDECLQNMGCQPILFIGSGISRRYFSGPSWEELLQVLAEECPLIDKPFAYYKQSYKPFDKIGSIFSEYYKEWAWSSGKESFPENLFTPNTPSNAYLKYIASEHLKKTTPNSLDDIVDSELKEEIDSLRLIKPHAIITTNFDQFIELVFPDYTPVVGQSILRQPAASVGEIFKIHGCVSDPLSLVLTEEDYKDFSSKKKYLSAKLLTFFAEHPLVFIGYSASDSNIRSILSDVDQILSPNGELIQNIYIVEWKEDISSKSYPARDKLIGVGEDKSVRINATVSRSFKWIYDAFTSSDHSLSINPKILRALMARTYNLVRSDIPNKNVEVDFSVLEHAASSEENLAKLYGITTTNDPSSFNANYPYSLTAVSEKLGFKGWHHAQKLIERVRQETGQNIKSSDNNYHVAVKTGNKSINHKYSDAAVSLLMSVASGAEYNIDLH